MLLRGSKGRYAKPRYTTGATGDPELGFFYLWVTNRDPKPNSFFLPSSSATDVYCILLFGDSESSEFSRIV